MADDLLQGLKDAIGNDNPEEAGGGDAADAMEKFIKSLENVPGVSEEDKEDLIKGLLQSGLGDLGGSRLPIGSPITNPWLEFVTLFGMISLVILLLGYIGYRLYNNMVQREKRKEQKKLQKEHKKKK